MIGRAIKWGGPARHAGCLPLRQLLLYVRATPCAAARHGAHCSHASRMRGPAAAEALFRVSAQRARAIIVLSQQVRERMVCRAVSATSCRVCGRRTHTQGGNPAESDAKAVRIVLSLKGLPELKGHVVVEVGSLPRGSCSSAPCTLLTTGNPQPRQMNDPDNEELAHLVLPEAVETVVSHDMIGRLMIHVRATAHATRVCVCVCDSRSTRTTCAVSSVRGSRGWPLSWSSCWGSTTTSSTSSAGSASRD